MRPFGGWPLAAFLLLAGFVLCCSSTNPGTSPAVQIKTIPKGVVLDNGLVQVTFSSPGGDVIGISYGGINNLLEVKNYEGNRGYWDVVWNYPGEISDKQYKLQGTHYKVITSTPNQAEISFVTIYNARFHRGGTAAVPVNVDKRYIMQRGRSGFYTYAIFERLHGFPGGDMDTVRVAYKLQQAKFNYMAVSDARQRFMPTFLDRETGTPLAYKEAVKLTDKTSNVDFAGEVDDKYQYSAEDKDIKVHGWISTDKNSPVGFWMISPSEEYRTGGPFKQDLTSHVGPTTMTVFSCSHYVGKKVGLKFQQGEPWKKVFGPVFIYLNAAARGSDSSSIIRTLWNNAKFQMREEVKSWPYSFINSRDFPTSDQRGSVLGRLLVFDRYVNKLPWTASAYVGLAPVGAIGSWQRESKGYQFWTQSDQKGYFFIKNVRPGKYNLFASVPGVIGDYKYELEINIAPGSKIQLPTLTYQPPRAGPTLWEIGIPDRTAAEFYVPEPYPNLINKLYTRILSDKFRQYGIWARYSERYPKNDLIYKVGASNYRTDWFYAQVTRNVNGQYIGTTWQIQFKLNNVRPGNHVLQLALASATFAELQIRVNNLNTVRPVFSTGLMGDDNAIARHGIHGLYWFWSINIPSMLLHPGENTIYLTQSRGGSAFQGVMYDYIRLEGPPQL